MNKVVTAKEPDLSDERVVPVVNLLLETGWKFYGKLRMRGRQKFTRGKFCCSVGPTTVNFYITNEESSFQQFETPWIDSIRKHIHSLDQE